MMLARIVAGAGRRVPAIGLSAAILLACAGCAGASSPSISPLVVRIADIQSGTIRVRLNQVVQVETGGRGARFAALVADEGIATVVVRRDTVTGRLEPEIVPHRVGTTQVALRGSSPLETTGFRVVVGP